MKDLLLTFVLLASFSLFSIDVKATNTDVEPTTTIIKIENLTTDQNMSIYDLFRQDIDYVIVNSCESLGLVVIDTRTSGSVSKSQAKLYITTKLSQLGLEQEVEVVSDQTKVGVMIDCRAKIQQLHDTGSER